MQGVERLRLAAALWLFVVAGCARVNEPSAQERWKIVARGLDVMARCPERVWPGYRWAGRRVVFYDRVQKTARFWRLPTTGGVSQTGELAFGELPEAAVTGSFSTAEIAGEPALFVSLDDTAKQNRRRREQAIAELDLDAALKYAFHESFHEVEQTAWPAPTVTDGGPFTRADPFPMEWRPRYLRLQLLYSLKAALRGEAELSAAAYWLERYRAEAAKEAVTVVPLEVREGSARYVEAVSGWLAREGCELSEADLQQTAGAEVTLGFPYAPRVAFESYSLGAVASLLLRAHRSPNWQQRVASGVSPISVLLEGIAPVPQPDDPQRVKRLRAAIEGTNQELADLLAPFLAATRSKDVIRVGLSGFTVLGSSDTLEPVQWTELPGEPVVVPSFTGTLSGTSGGRVELRGAQPFYSASSPCGSKALTVLIRGADLHEQGGVFSAKSPNVDLSNVSAARIEHRGTPWICARDETQRD
jgi:hypothetical protein